MRGSGLNGVNWAGRCLLGAFLLAGAAGCAANSNYAPVTYYHKADMWDRPVVNQGDTSKKVPLPGSARAERLAESEATSAQPTLARRASVRSETLEPADAPAPAPVSSRIGGTHDAYPDQTRPLDPPIVVAAQGPAESAGGGYEVVVGPGETLYGLSRTHGVERQTIIAANGLAAPYELKVGQRIVIPRSEGRYTVKPGDTLYSISRSTGADVRTLAAANNIREPNALVPGQTLRIPAGGVPSSLVAARTVSSDTVGGPLVRPGSQPNPTAGNPAKRKSPSTPTGFAWPAKGQIIAEFGPGEKGQRNDGITIRLPQGAAIRAARGGEVIYVGSELKGFGNLVLVRHEDGYVTAYAHASRIHVRRGQFVERGQHIADVGRSGDAAEPQLHFEIRKDRKPVDPRGYLPAI